MDAQQARTKYLEAAIVHSTTTPEDPASIRKVNKASDTILKALKELRATPDRGAAFLKELLRHENSGVRCWAATHLLSLDARIAVAVLTEIAEELPRFQSGSDASFNAQIVLQEWKAGRLDLE